MILTPHRLDPRDSRWITAPLIRDARVWRQAYADNPIRRAEVRSKVWPWLEARLLANPGLTLREWRVITGYFGLRRQEPLSKADLVALVADPGTPVEVAWPHVMRLLYWLLVVQQDGTVHPERLQDRRRLSWAAIKASVGR